LIYLQPSGRKTDRQSCLVKCFMKIRHARRIAQPTRQAAHGQPA
jgi:hypothetical protein